MRLGLCSSLPLRCQHTRGVAAGLGLNRTTRDTGDQNQDLDPFQRITVDLLRKKLFVLRCLPCQARRFKFWVYTHTRVCAE